jgi:hypothetical protein
VIPEQGSNAAEGHTGPSGANSPVEWVDCEDYQSWYPYAEPLDHWKARQLEDAPYRSPDHWEALARAAGLSVTAATSTPVGPSEGQRPSGHAEPCPPSPAPAPSSPSDAGHSGQPSPTAQQSPEASQSPES